MYKLYCCGSRGSRPVEGRRFNEFGGFTTCYILKAYDYALIIDAGTGFYSANSIVSDCTKIDVVLTHVHYDHLLGMLDWTAIPKTAKINFYGNFDGWFGDKTMYEFFRAPFWPVQPNFIINQCPADGEPLKLRKDLQVKFYNSPHPNGAKLMMIETNNSDEENPIDLDMTDPKDIHKLAVMFDCEQSDGLPKDMIDGIDMIIYDGMYTDKEYPTKIGYGHSTWQEGVRLALRVKPEKLIITHHSPDREDSDLRDFEAEARTIYPETDFARSGQTWTFPLNQAKVKKEKPSIEQIISDDLSGDTKEDEENVGLRTKIIRKLTNSATENNTVNPFIASSMYLIFGVISLIMTVVNIYTKQTIMGIVTTVFGFASILNYILAKNLVNKDEFLRILFAFEFLPLLAFFVLYGEPNGFSVIWSLFLPTAGMLTFGKKKTMILSTMFFVFLAFVFWTPIGRELIFKDSLGNITYTKETLERFPLVFIAFTAVGYFLELIKEIGYKKLSVLKNNLSDVLADQTSELRDQNFELLRVNSQLGLRNRLLNKTFGKFMPDQVIEEVLENANTSEVTGKNSFVTLLQADIRGFASNTSDMDPNDIFDMLNHYFSEMTEIIQKHNGVILDYVGDAMLVVFGAPIAAENHADDAIEAAIEMQKAMRKVNSWNRIYGYKEIQIGIGINTGEVFLGTVGSKNHMKYDAVGKNVSLTSRIEHVCAPKSILVTQEVINNIKKSVKINGARTEKLKGFDTPVQLFEISE